MSGGYRRRWIQWDAAVWCPGGRWGPRRTRVSECYATIRSETLYSALLLDKERSKAGPNARGSATFHIGDREVTVAWELRANAVWTHGRLFLKCPRCTGCCTRLYLPLSHSAIACRSCWGLTYNSRTLSNYKDSLWGRGSLARMFATSQRDWAYLTTDEARKARREASRERWRRRRESTILTT